MASQAASNVNHGDTLIVRDSTDDPWCCGSYGIDELRLGFGCPRHTRGPL
jgi:hypothetical protein